MPRTVLLNFFPPSPHAVPLDPNELDPTSQHWSTQTHLSSLPSSGYFKPDFVFWACSFYVPESINWLICKRRQQGACVWVKHWDVTHFLLPLFPFGFGHSTCHLVESQQLPVNQSNTGNNSGGREDTAHFLVLQAFLHHFCSLVKPLLSKINDCAGVLFPFGREGRTTLLICCPGSWDER